MDTLPAATCSLSTQRLAEGLRLVGEREGLTQGEQIRRALTEWLSSRGIL